MRFARFEHGQVDATRDNERFHECSVDVSLIESLRLYSDNRGEQQHYSAHSQLLILFAYDKSFLASSSTVRI